MRWGSGETKVMQQAVWSLRALTNNPTAARAIVMSNAWAQLAAAVVSMVRGDASAGRLAQLPPETQGHLLALVLSPTRCIGSEAAAYPDTEDLSSTAVQEAVEVKQGIQGIWRAWQQLCLFRYHFVAPSPSPAPNPAPGCTIRCFTRRSASGSSHCSRSLAHLLCNVCNGGLWFAFRLASDDASTAHNVDETARGEFGGECWLPVSVTKSVILRHPPVPCSRLSSWMPLAHHGALVVLSQLDRVLSLHAGLLLSGTNARVPGNWYLPAAAGRCETMAPSLCFVALHTATAHRPHCTIVLPLTCSCAACLPCTRRFRACHRSPLRPGPPVCLRLLRPRCLHGRANRRSAALRLCCRALPDVLQAPPGRRISPQAWERGGS
jgi:hypothetical protein